MGPISSQSPSFANPIDTSSFNSPIEEKKNKNLLKRNLQINENYRTCWNLTKRLVQ